MEEKSLFEWKILRVHVVFMVLDKGKCTQWAVGRCDPRGLHKHLKHISTVWHRLYVQGLNTRMHVYSAVFQNKSYT